MPRTNSLTPDTRPAPRRAPSPGGELPRELPYSRQVIEQDDVDAVVDALRAPLLTTGARVPQFERAIANRVGAAHAVAVSSGTAALHAALAALDVGPGDEVIVPPITFAATANVAVLQGATPIFVDVDPETLLIDPACVEQRLSPRTRAVIAVDYAGQPCDYTALRSVTRGQGVALIADACHSLGAADRGRPVGSLADLTCFSFHPVKAITTGEGGMVTTDDAALAARMRRFRSHGISSDHAERRRSGSWRYEMVELGCNYRLSDVQCALGLSQLRKLPHFVTQRQAIAARYDALLSEGSAIRPLASREDATHARHLYVVRVPAHRRDEAYAELHAAGIGVNVHYVPVHLHPFYRQRFGTRPGLCPRAEAAFEQVLSLPVFCGMRDEDVDRVVAELRRAVARA